MNIGIVLSGGMAKGAYQIGALRAINRFIPTEEIKYMSCSSVGVLNGYAYATDSLDKIETVWKNICDNNARLLINQILKSTLLQQKITEIHDGAKNIPFDFYYTLLDFNHRNIIYKNLRSVEANDIPLYLKASVAMPIYNQAIRINDDSYFDGAMVDNIPVYPLLNKKLDYIICIYFDDICYKFENSNFDNKIIKITFPSENILRQSVVFTSDSIEDMISNGYTKTLELIKPIFSGGYDNVEHIYRSIEDINQQSKDKNFRITGDVFVTNLNMLTRRLTKRKIL